MSGLSPDIAFLLGAGVAALIYVAVWTITALADRYSRREPIHTFTVTNGIASKDPELVYFLSRRGVNIELLESQPTENSND